MSIANAYALASANHHMPYIRESVNVYAIEFALEDTSLIKTASVFLWLAALQQHARNAWLQHVQATQENARKLSKNHLWHWEINGYGLNPKALSNYMTLYYNFKPPPPPLSLSLSLSFIFITPPSYTQSNRCVCPCCVSKKDPQYLDYCNDLSPSGMEHCKSDSRCTYLCPYTGRWRNKVNPMDTE